MPKLFAVTVIEDNGIDNQHIMLGTMNALNKYIEIARIYNLEDDILDYFGEIHDGDSVKIVAKPCDINIYDNHFASDEDKEMKRLCAEKALENFYNFDKEKYENTSKKIYVVNIVDIYQNLQTVAFLNKETALTHFISESRKLFNKEKYDDFPRYIAKMILEKDSNTSNPYHTNLYHINIGDYSISLTVRDIELPDE